MPAFKNISSSINNPPGGTMLSGGAPGGKLTTPATNVVGQTKPVPVYDESFDTLDANHPSWRNYFTQLVDYWGGDVEKAKADFSSKYTEIAGKKGVTPDPNDISLATDIVTNKPGAIVEVTQDAPPPGPSLGGFVDFTTDIIGDVVGKGSEVVGEVESKAVRGLAKGIGIDPSQLAKELEPPKVERPAGGEGGAPDYMGITTGAPSEATQPGWLEQKTGEIEEIPVQQAEAPKTPEVVASTTAPKTEAPTLEPTQIGEVKEAKAPDIAQQNIERERKLAEILEARMAGKTPSVAEIQQNQAFEQARAAQASALASQRGGPTAAGLRGTQEQMAQLQQQQGVQAAMLRAQEQQQAAEQYRGLVATGRTADIETGRVLSDVEKFNVTQQNTKILEQAKIDWESAKQTAEYQWLANQDYTTRQQAVNDMLARDTNAAANLAAELGVRVDIANMDAANQAAFRKQEMKNQLLKMGLDEARADKEAQQALEMWKAQFGEQMHQFDAQQMWQYYAAKMGLFGAALGAGTELLTGLVT